MRFWAFLFLFTVCGWAQQPQAPQQQAPEPEPTPMELPLAPVGTVYGVKDRGFVSNLEVDDERVKTAVDRLVMAVTGKSSVAEAWGSLVKPTDRVGLKISASGGPYFATHHAVVNAVVSGLRSAGVGRILLWDRSLDELKEAGYWGKDRRAGNYEVRWCYPGRAYSAKNVYVSTVLGQLIWGDLDFTRRYSSFELLPGAKPKDNLSSNSHFATVLTTEVDKVINLPVLSAHASCGVAGALYNMTIPNIDNWRRFTTGFGESDPAIPEIYSDPVVVDKVVLNIMDGMIGQFAGGPEYQPNYTVPHATLYASKDPVALDTVALKLIDKWRMRARMKPNAKDANYLQTAREYGLGNAGAGEVKMLP